MAISEKYENSQINLLSAIDVEWNLFTAGAGYRSHIVSAVFKAIHLFYFVQWFQTNRTLVACLFAIGTEPAVSTSPSVESGEQQASDVVPCQPQNEMRRGTSVQSDPASLLEQQIKDRQSKIANTFIVCRFAAQHFSYFTWRRRVED